MTAHISLTLLQVPDSFSVTDGPMQFGFLFEDNVNQAEIQGFDPEDAKTHEYMIYRRPDSRIGTSLIFKDLGTPLKSISSRLQRLRHGHDDMEDLPVSKNLEEGTTLVVVW